MEKIKFAKRFNKLKDCGEFITLIDVILYKMDQLSEELRYYDTDGKYELPYDGKMLLLIFQKENGEIMTTFRNISFENNDKYLNNLGAKFQVIIECE